MGIGNRAGVPRCGIRPWYSSRLDSYICGAVGALSTLAGTVQTVATFVQWAKKPDLQQEFGRGSSGRGTQP